MVEHLVCNQVVVGSSPVASTMLELRVELRSRGEIHQGDEMHPDG